MKKSTHTPNEITFENMPQALSKVYEEVSFIRTQLSELKQNFEPKVPTELLTRNEAADWFKCNLSTIHNWTVRGILIPHGISGRVYYKRSEIEATLIAFGKNRGADNE